MDFMDVDLLGILLVNLSNHFFINSSVPITTGIISVFIHHN